MIQIPKPDAEQLFRTYSITSFAVSKDESRIAFSTNLSGKYNVWGIDLGQHYPYPLTTQDQTPAYIRFDPVGRYILVGFDNDGDENVQMYLVSPHGGALQPIRTAPGRRHYLASISDDGNRIYYCSDKDNHMYLNGYVYDLETDSETILYEGAKAPTFLADVAKDESSFVTFSTYANTYVVAHVHQGDQRRCLTPDEGVVHVVSSLQYVGRHIVFTTNYGEDDAYVARFDLDTGEFERVWKPERGGAEQLVVHEPANVAYVSVSYGVRDALFQIDLKTFEATPIACPADVIAEMHIGESGALYVRAMRDIAPSNLYVRKPDGSWTSLTGNRVMGVAESELVPAEVVRFPSYDGLELEALWFQANPALANGYTVVWPHGGPQASERKTFRPFFQFLLLRGYNVFAPNFRGSSDYGAKFMKMVERDWGEGPRLDMVASIEWLIRQGMADRSRLFLVGGSYGGYMTLLLHGRHADYFQACVDIFGPCNLITFAQSVPDHWKPMMKQWLGDPDDPADRERLIQDSPITYLDGMTKPMLVIQGANDPRVVQAESDQIVAALRNQGREVEYIVFPDEGHGFMKKDNEIAAYKRIVDFLDEHRLP
ncbi:S9 family peptidase [Alicyclobacillus hesperidum]|uniref:S9 family peptidase n=1 Tax=Alicyclobacillus hesperidum TaxID=89784 RepID=UPI0003178D0F|nr:S9 family peptidase [Alicyclobacillus hesperidum]